MNDWKMRHRVAMQHPKTNHEKALVLFIQGLEAYKLAHGGEFEWSLKNDYVLGPAISQIALGVRTLLTGEKGRLDGGTLDAILSSYIHEED